MDEDINVCQEHLLERSLPKLLMMIKRGDISIFDYENVNRLFQFSILLIIMIPLVPISLLEDYHW